MWFRRKQLWAGSKQGVNFRSISKDSKGNFLIKVSLRYEESIQYLVIGEGREGEPRLNLKGNACQSVSSVYGAKTDYQWRNMN